MEVIGIDHGNAAMKTRNFCFPSGVAEYEHEPFAGSDVLEYYGKYYVCGTGRQPFLKDKTSDQRYFILTLAAIAKELRVRKIPSPANIIIGAGLPLTNYGREKKRFTEYLLSHPNPIRFKYDGMGYEINIRGIKIYPQAFAALFLHMNTIIGEPSVIVADVGGWTVDLMRLDHGMPDAESCRSLELGIIRCMDEIAEQVRRRTGLSVTSSQIESVLKDEPCSVHEKAKTIIMNEGKSYAKRLISAISESGLDPYAMPILFMGGGAMLMKKHTLDTLGLFRPIIIPDVCMNAKGYEFLCGNSSGGVS